ncbi:MAG: hypothetical protein HY748_16015 [Elusimicrobia bacterium]|nr:hypothetical protein [Elusimicrobiota bacterium]
MAANVLGINDGFSAGVTVLKDGRLTAQVNEERFCRKKNYGGFPALCLDWLLSSGTRPDDLQAVGLAWRSEPFRDISERDGGKHRVFSSLARWLPAAASSDALISRVVERSARRRRRLTAVRRALAAAAPPLSRLPIRIYAHHHCHAASSYFASGLARRDCRDALVITMDGSGDGECFTVWRARGSRLEKLAAQNSYHSLAILLEAVTSHMGMKPLEHEYKIMGMAPYGGGFQAEAAAGQFRRYFSLDRKGLLPVNRMAAWGDSMEKRLARDFRRIRFDAIAYGIQQVFSELVLGLVRSWVRETGIRDVCVGGGSFMNVKLNMTLAQDDGIGEFFALPSCGDESLSLGAAYLAHEELAPGSSPALGPLYLGPANSEAEVLAALEAARDHAAWERKPDIERTTAELLRDGRIVARVRGPMEWGARALGNRSILCNPTKMQMIHRINKAIKMRDFWMPFCPSILPADADRYLVNPRGRSAPYMILAFESRRAAQEELPACLHPFDLTCRPQIVDPEHNPRYHYLLEQFKLMTGIGGVLNTSFNLHGEPIVCTAADAIRVLRKSGLDFLALEDYLVWRKDAPSGL